MEGFDDLFVSPLLDEEDEEAPSSPLPAKPAATHKKRKRACCFVRRSKVSCATVVRVPVETWVLVCSNIFFSPHTVFRLMMACRGLWGQLSHDVPWWDAFYNRVLRYQGCLLHSNIADRLRHYREQVSMSSQQALRLICSPRCSGCGARYGHFVFRPLQARLCDACLSARLISNRVLWARYGLEVFRFLQEYLEADCVLLPLCHYRRRLGMERFMRLSCDPLDHADKKRELLFMLCADVEHVLGVRLDDALRAQHAAAKAAACTIAASVRRLFAQRCWRAGRKGPKAAGAVARRSVVLPLQIVGLKRATDPLTPTAGWIEGGPMFAHCASGGRRSVRDGFTEEQAQRLLRAMRRDRSKCWNPVGDLMLFS